MNVQSAAAQPFPDPVLLREDLEGLAVLTLNRPKTRNTLSEAMLAALADEFTAIAEDRAIRAVVLAAKGPAFSGGHDLKELTARRTDTDHGRAYFQHIMLTCSAMMQQIVHLPQPVIAAVQGTATAAGCQLVASCDLAIASAAGEVRSVGNQCRPVLLDSDGGALAQYRPQACDGDVAHRRSDFGAGQRFVSASSIRWFRPEASWTRHWRSAARSPGSHPMW